MIDYETPFERISIRDAKVVHDVSGFPVLDVKDPHALIQAAGYAKYVTAKDKGQNVYFRGQRRLYGGMRPSLHRNFEYPEKQDRWLGQMNCIISEYQREAASIRRLDARVVEAILQHYGVSTTWIDLVDNIWVALWFACYRAMTAGKHFEYLHFEQRDVLSEPQGGYAYICLIRGAAIMDLKLPGFYRDSETEVIDLRASAPSLFLRPHAQHGVLFRLKGEVPHRAIDYQSAMFGVIRVSLNNALQWLGNGGLLSVHTLFPPPSYDQGYKFLLEADVVKRSGHGSIQHVGA